MTEADAVAPPYAARRAALAERLATADVDALLVSALPNIRYLTGFSGSSALVLVGPADCLLLTDFRYETQVRDEVDPAVRVAIVSQSLWTALFAELAKQPAARRIGFESAHLLHRDFQRLLEQGGRATWRPLVDVVETLRERKDATEVAAIRRAVALAEDALRATLPAVRAGLTETHVAGLLEGALRERGSEGFPFPSIVASGPRSALPHARAGDRRLAPGDFVLFDFGAVVDGYCSDMTRTVVLGTADAEQREVYGVVAEAQWRAATGVRVGMAGKDADALAREYIDARGYGELFGHSLGHGIGLEVHEAPRLARSTDAPLVEGAVVGGGWGGIRIEDDVLLTAGGPVVLGAFPRTLLELP